MSVLPPLVRNWLIGRYLEDPTPGLCSLSDEGQPEPVVFVRYSDFTDFLVQAGIELLPNLDVWRKAGWITDVMAVITLSAKEGSKPLPYVLARLNLSPGRHRLIGIRRAVFDAPVETGEGEKPKPPDDPYADLRDFACSELKGQERAVIEALCDAGGELTMADVKTLCEWEDPIDDAWNSLRKRLNNKIRPHGWNLETHDRRARLKQASATISSKFRKRP